jgi:hypothetical protein
MRRWALIGIVASLCSTAALADPLPVPAGLPLEDSSSSEPSDAQLQLAGEFLETAGAEWRLMASTGMAQAFLGAIDRRDDADGAVSRQYQAQIESMPERNRVMLESARQAYARHFTAGELRELTAFSASEAGRVILNPLTIQSRPWPIRIEIYRGYFTAAGQAEFEAFTQTAVAQKLLEVADSLRAEIWHRDGQPSEAELRAVIDRLMTNETQDDE